MASCKLRLAAVISTLLSVATLATVSRSAEASLTDDPTRSQRAAMAGQAARKFAEICAACHGADGEGKPDLKTPSIAALPDWYVETQLTKFRESIRGGNEKDTGGLQMHAIAGTLEMPMIRALAELVSRLPLRPTQNTLKGDLVRGRFLFGDICMQCHRYNASGELVFRSPPLHGLQDWYIEIQLRKFRDGVRGSHERDIKGAKMHLMVRDLTDRDLQAVASYISVLAARYLPKSDACGN